MMKSVVRMPAARARVSPRSNDKASATVGPGGRGGRQVPPLVQRTVACNYCGEGCGFMPGGLTHCRGYETRQQDWAQGRKRHDCRDEARDLGSAYPAREIILLQFRG